jgi:hypothetical protein
LWPKKIGAEYLISRTGRKAERAFAAALSDALGGLPLAHEQTAAYCERLELPLSAYHKRFEDTPARMLDSKRDAPADYRLTVAKTFALAIDEAAKLRGAMRRRGTGAGAAHLDRGSGGGVSNRSPRRPQKMAPSATAQRARISIGNSRRWAARGSRGTIC